MSPSAAQTVLERCDRLAACSDEPGRITRLFASPAAAEAAALVEGWMRDAGLAVRRDAVGNVVGRWEADDPAGRTLLIGSHLDTVRDAGRFDGTLGVLVGLAAIERLRASRESLPFAIELLAFADEEGVRYGTAYLGSSPLAGGFAPEWMELRDADGVTLREALEAFGGDPDAVAGERRDPSTLLGYCEVHIEQGPLLEAEGAAVGIVTAIYGQTRARAVFKGVPGHAGTVPMSLRRDALCAAAEWITEVEALAAGIDDLVATVGELRVEPGAPNVVPGRVQASLDVRHSDDGTRATAAAGARELAERIAARRGVELDWRILQETPARECAAPLVETLADAVAATGQPTLRLASGAGHDAAALAPLTGVAMLFVRCAGGVSHHPAESVAEADVAVAIDALVAFVERLAARNG